MGTKHIEHIEAKLYSGNYQVKQKRRKQKSKFNRQFLYVGRWKSEDDYDCLEATATLASFGCCKVDKVGGRKTSNREKSYAAAALPLQFRVTGKDTGKISNNCCKASKIAPLREFRAPRQRDSLANSCFFPQQFGAFTANFDLPLKNYCMFMLMHATKAKLTKAARVLVQREILTRTYVGRSKKDATDHMKGNVASLTFTTVPP